MSHSTHKRLVILTEPQCHRLSTWLNCLTGLSRGIVSIVVILPVICIVRTSVLLSLVFPCSYRLALGQRPSPIYSFSCCCLVGPFIALDGPCLLCLPLCLPICLLSTYRWLTDCLVTPIGNGPYPYNSCTLPALIWA